MHKTRRVSGTSPGTLAPRRGCSLRLPCRLISAGLQIFQRKVLNAENHDAWIPRGIDARGIATKLHLSFSGREDESFRERSAGPVSFEYGAKDRARYLHRASIIISRCDSSLDENGFRAGRKVEEA